MAATHTGILAICEVTDQEEKKMLFMNLAGLDLRRMVKGLVVPAPPNQENGNPGDSYRALQMQCSLIFAR